MKKKLIILINGKGESDKDICIDEVNRYYTICNISSIDPYKQAAYMFGWDGNKDFRSRKFLSDMKKLSINYNNYPLAFILQKIESFKSSEAKIMFIHIKEPEEINKVVNRLEDDNSIIYTTLLIDKPSINGYKYGNTSDDNVLEYGYQYTFKNTYADEVSLRDAFMSFFSSMIIELFKR